MSQQTFCYSWVTGFSLTVIQIVYTLLDGDRPCFRYIHTSNRVSQKKCGAFELRKSFCCGTVSESKVSVFTNFESSLSKFLTASKLEESSFSLVSNQRH